MIQTLKRKEGLKMGKIVIVALVVVVVVVAVIAVIAKKNK